ncbi:DMT family transporter [Lutimonas vermicola]|uniref:DMT family transporter n=1 Tax=Lutimonas vermicola TaxID=414288 RepID=A0ABU9KYB0_9FLAO
MIQNKKTKIIAQTVIYTFLALSAFAANSVICRLALKEKAIDPGLFTGIRLISGASVLAILVFLSRGDRSSYSKGSWVSGFVLFLYAAAFSYAYITLETGTGALIIFGSVQITMIAYSLLSGYKMSVWEWLGVFLSIAGFVYLMLPDAKTPSVSGFVLMTISGVSWGLYSIRGRDSKNPLNETAFNFLRATPFLMLLLFFIAKDANASTKGILLALLSGTITSGIGYTIWYMALKELSSIQASIVQLFVPVLAAIGGVIFVGELISSKLIIASLMILGGVFLLIVKKTKVKTNL